MPDSRLDTQATEDDSRLEKLLRERTRFQRLVHVPTCSSTQDLAAADPGGDDAVFWADHQTRGRGRQQHEWHDEPGADLAATFRLRARLPEPLALPAAVPVAVLLALEPSLPAHLRLKWPNDLFHDDRKLCGVLIDAGVGNPDTYLIGIGVNVNRTRFPPDLEARATSLALCSGRMHDRGALLLAIAAQLDAAVTALLQQRPEPLETVFRQRLGLMQREVLVRAGGDHRGRLMALDFRRLVLAPDRALPLGAVTAIASATDRG